MPAIGLPSLVSQLWVVVETGLGSHFLPVCRCSLQVLQRQEGEGDGGVAGWGG